VNALQKRFFVFIGVKKSDGQEPFEAPSVVQDVCVSGDEGPTTTLMRRVYVKCVAPVLGAEDSADIAKVLGAAMIIPRIHVF